MKNILKRITSVILTGVLVMSLSVTAFAADSSLIQKATDIADKLYAVGIFNGTGLDSNGKPIYELERTAKRSEGIAMLVRLMGKANEAEKNKNSYNTPFVDVPNWVKGAVGYAYENKLTAGTSATTFSPNRTISNTEYITLCLRALNYESGEDFEWEKAAVKATELGIIKNGEYINRQDTFVRADMVIISYNTLLTKMKNSNQTLAEYLGIDLDTSASKPENPGTVPNDKTTVIDTNDPNSGYVADTGEVLETLLPEGSILKRDGFKYNSSLSKEDNLSNFKEIMAEMITGLEATSDGGFEYDGRKLFYVKNKEGSSWAVTVDKWGATFSNGVSSTGSKEARTFALNAMVYFGDESMAKAVYGMIDEHYRFRSDNSQQITTELAAKYGLTISTVNVDMFTISADVSNGSSTWRIVYDLSNDLAQSGLGVTIK